MSSRCEWTPRPYQADALEFALAHERCGLFLDMSLGKTAVVLTALRELVYDRAEIGRALVIAPPRVARDTWPAEAAKWPHLKDLRVVPVLGTPKQREAALARPGDVYVVSNMSVEWLAESGLWDFDCIVVDELSAFKNPKAKRFRALRRKAASASRVIGLTGTPSPNGLMDLWAQMYVIDGGERLGKTLTAYRDRWFSPGRRKGMVVYEWLPREGADDEIHEALSSCCMVKRKADCLADLPPKLFADVPVTLPEKAMGLYRRVERDCVAELDGSTLVAATAAAVSSKLQQIADGAAYDDEGAATPVHTAKLDTLREMVQAADGSPMLVFYAFRFERDALLEGIPGARVLDTAQDMEDWNAGLIPVAVAHPASVGHGLNLQHGGHTAVWYGMTWSLEMYQQANDRLHRPGQTDSVTVYRLIAQGTVDQAAAQALDRKERGQDALLEYLKERAEAYGI